MVPKIIKSYETFLNENNLSDYSINEGFSDKIKEKISSLWNKLSFKNKIDISEKIINVVSKTKLSLCFAYVLYILIIIVDQFTDEIDLQNTRWVSTCIFWLIFLSTTFISAEARKLRKKSIREKVLEMREKFDSRWFTYIFILLGENEDVIKAVQRMRYDNILNDKDILITDDVIMIDLSGYFIERGDKNVKDEVTNVIDPYHEEAWTDEEERLAEDPNSLKNRIKLMKTFPMFYIERLYNIKFRNINEIRNVSDQTGIHDVGFQLTNFKREKLKRENSYTRFLNKYRNKLNDI
jgi:hypothetical protein